MAYNRYINKFPTNVEFEKYIKTGIAEVPNTALIDDTGEMKYTRKLTNDYIFYGTTCTLMHSFGPPLTQLPIMKSAVLFVVP